MTPQTNIRPLRVLTLLALPLLALSLNLIACGGGGQEAADPVSRGAKIFARSGCATCHGPEGKGDGASAAAMTTKPRDLTKVADFRTERTVDAVAKLIAEGSPTGAMPPYPFLSDEERKDLAAFCLSLAGK